MTAPDTSPLPASTSRIKPTTSISTRLIAIKSGDPLLRLTLDWNDNERNMMKFMSLEAAEIARTMGARDVAMPTALGHYDVTS